MSRNVFKSFESLGVNQRAGVIISETTKGYKIETFSAYSDDQEYIYYISFDNEFYKGIEWDQVINDYGITNYQLLMERIQQGYIKPYKTIKK